MWVSLLAARRLRPKISAHCSFNARLLCNPAFLLVSGVVWLFLLQAIRASTTHHGAPHCMVGYQSFVSKWNYIQAVVAASGGGERWPCNFSEEVSCFVTLSNGELLFSLPLPLSGPHHSNMWQWSIWMSLTRVALRSSLHSPHSLNRSNWIMETGGVGELLVKQTKGLLTSPMTLYLQEKLRERCHLQSNLPLWWCKNK